MKQSWVRSDNTPKSCPTILLNMFKCFIVCRNNHVHMLVFYCTQKQCSCTSHSDANIAIFRNTSKHYCRYDVGQVLLCLLVCLCSRCC